MKPLLLILAIAPFLSTSRVPICTNDFKLVNGKCLGFVTDLLSRKDASKSCYSNFGATLATVKNEQESLAMAAYVGNHTKKVWIGLYCFASDPSTCVWDDGSKTNNSYTNFASNFPFADIDKCVFLKTTGSKMGEWFSGDCVEDRMAYVCEKPTTFADECEHNYNGYCYLTSGEMYKENSYFDEAHNVCEQNCGSLVSIHSVNELRFIEYIYRSSGIDSIYIGASSAQKNEFQWLDNSEWNYTKLDTTSGASGKCMTMSLKSEWARTKGHWYPSDCHKPRSFLCKRHVGATTCDIPTPQASPLTGTPTYTSNCNSFLMAPDTFSSPDYPQNYTNNMTCTYHLATIGAQRIRLAIPSVELEDECDFLRVYDGESEESPMLAKMTGETATAQYYESSSNTMFVTFTSDPFVESKGFHANFFSFV